MQERGIECTDIPQNQSYAVQVGKHSQQMCPWPSVTGDFVTKPMSHVAALRLVPNQIRYQIQYAPYARCGLHKGVAITKGRGEYSGCVSGCEQESQANDDGRHPPESPRGLSQCTVLNTAPEEAWCYLDKGGVGYAAVTGGCQRGYGRLPVASGPGGGGGGQGLA